MENDHPEKIELTIRELDEITSKEKNFWDILDAAVTLDVQKGHLKWSITDVAKNSGHSRTLVYYYFGKSKENILKEAINFFNRFVLGTTPGQLDY